VRGAEVLQRRKGEEEKRRRTPRKPATFLCSSAPLLLCSSAFSGQWIDESSVDGRLQES
jgi:hypothetical protein